MWGSVRTFFGVVLACLLVSGAGGLAVLMPANAASTGNSAPHPGRIVSDNPSGFTPHVMDGQVQTLAQVGNMIIVGGSFTTVRNAGSSTDITREQRLRLQCNDRPGQHELRSEPERHGLQGPAGRGRHVGLPRWQFHRITSGGTNVSVSRLTKLSDGDRDT